MQPEVRVDSCTSPAAAPERILAPCAGQGLTYNLHEASRCAQPWLQPMHQYAFNPSWGQQQAMDQSWQQHQGAVDKRPSLAARFAFGGRTLEARAVFASWQD